MGGEAFVETRYTRLDDADIAYQVVGDGPLDLVFCSGTQHVEVQWEHPTRRAFLNRLASFSRLILFDRRGWGASDPLPHGAAPTWEGWAEDIGAVLDAVGSQSAALFGELDAGPICSLFTAMHPHRVRALILGNTAARNLVAPDYPLGYTVEEGESLADLVSRSWGSTELAEIAFPDRAGDLDFLRWAAKLQRAAATPRSAAAQYRYMIMSMDVRAALPLIQAPTLVLHTRGNPFTPIAHGRHLAEQIDGAKLVEFDTDDALFYADVGDRAVDEVAMFLTGRLPPVEVDRVLTTILFTDIVDSTARAAAVGDHRWRSLLEAHDRAVREQIGMFRGEELDTTGDGFVVSFDGPARAIKCAKAIAASTATLGISVRAGLHTGECQVTTDGLSGLAVHIAARVAATARSDEVLVSGTVKDLVIGSGLAFENRGEHQLKGVPGTWPLFRVKD